MLKLKAVVFAFTFAVAKSSLNCPTTKGQPCIFPFIYKGVEYSECVPGRSNTSWCATEVDDDGVSYRAYGYCVQAKCEEYKTMKEMQKEIQPRERCDLCIEAAPFEVSLQCIQPCVTEYTFSTCFNCLIETATRQCLHQCGNIGIKRWPGLALTGDRSCSSFRSSGPYGSQTIMGAWNDEKTWLANGDIEMMGLATGEVEEYIVITKIEVKYGSDVDSPIIEHGGNGGEPTNDLIVPAGSKVVQVKIHTNGNHIGGLKFKYDDGTWANDDKWFGLDQGQVYDTGDQTDDGCHLAYMSGTATLAINSLTFHWCCNEA